MEAFKELLKKIQKYEIRIRKALNSQMQGDFHSIFKGSGLEFDDVRAYQYGDDVRTIDWIVSAKGHGTFVKTFREEKEQTVFFLVDLSKSQEIGASGKQKIDLIKEITSVLAFSALHESSQVGLIGYSDQKELYIRPNKGKKQGYQLFGQLYKHVTQSPYTNLSKALNYTLNMLKRRSVVILISDFIDDNYEHQLKAMARKHDLVVIRIHDERESKLPRMGIIPLLDKESGKTIWRNTSSANFRRNVSNMQQEGAKHLEDLCKRYQASYVSIRTDEDYVPKLIKLFKVRNLSKKSV